MINLNNTPIECFGIVEKERAMKTHRLLKTLAVVTVIGAYVMIVLGVLVTTTGSGQGCGNSWPFCRGQIIPGSLTVQGVTEYSHRIMSSADGFLVLLLTIWSWFTYRSDGRIKLYAFLSLLFVLAQGALGAFTVVFEGTLALNWLLSIHFGLSLIAFASVVLLTTRLFQIEKEQQGQVERPPAPASWLQLSVWGLAIYTYLVVYTGALVEHTGAVVGCGYEVPGCGSTYLPNFTSLAGIQVLHRYAAGLLWLCVLILLVAVMRRYRGRRDIVTSAWWALILITLQAAGGIVNIMTTGQMLAALVHATLISIFFSVLCCLCAQVGWPGRSKKLAQPLESWPTEPEAVANRS